MIVIVTGSRYWTEDRYDDVRNTLATGDITHAILGDARGVDTLAKWACEELLIPHTVMKADWARYGRAAGPRRNGEMIREGRRMAASYTEDVECWYFHDHLADSRGTANCVKQALENRINAWSYKRVLDRA